MQFLRIYYYKDDRKCAYNLVLWLVRIFGYIFFLSVMRNTSLPQISIRSKALSCLLLASHSHPTLGRTPLDEWSARRRDLYLTTHETHKTQTSMSSARSNPQFQQASGRRPSPLTARPLGSAQAIKVKESRNRPDVAQRVPGGLGSQFPWRSAHEGSEVSLTHLPPLPPGNVPGTHFH